MTQWSRLVHELFRHNQFRTRGSTKEIGQVMEKEKFPFRSAFCVLVSGTNGKGTVASLLSSILQSHGLKVGLFTSPHLISFEERFRVNGKPVERTVDLLEYVFKNYKERLTYFELTTLLGSLIFKEKQVDVSIYECGLGGKTDATNVIDPDLSIITTLGYDHLETLGRNLENIACHKYGIVRPKIPLVIGRQEHPEADFTLRRLAENHESVYFLDSKTEHKNTAGEAAKIALSRLKIKYSEEKMDEGVKKHRWPGRYDIRNFGDLRFLHDGAHNLDAVRNFCSQIKERKLETGDLVYVVFGVMKEKAESEKMLKQVLNLFKRVEVFAALVDNPRSATVNEFRVIEKLLNFHFKKIAKTAEIMEFLKTRQKSGKPEQVDCVVFGSFYLIGEVFDYMNIEVSDLISNVA